jgi:hypothetical protein
MFIKASGAMFECLFTGFGRGIVARRGRSLSLMPGGSVPPSQKEERRMAGWRSSICRTRYPSTPLTLSSDSSKCVGREG